VQPVNDTHFREFYEFGSVSRSQLFQRTRLCVINGEIMAIQLVSLETSSPIRYRIKGVLRGLFDTSRQTHASGSQVFLWRADEPPFTVNEQTGWASGVTLSLQAVPYTASQNSTQANMTVNSLSLSDRAQRPYAVGSLLVDGKSAAHRPGYTEGVAFRVSWVPRNLVVGSTVEQCFATNPTVDAGLDFVVRVYDPDDNLVSGPHTVANSATVTDSLDVVRTYKDITIASGGYDYVTVVVNSRKNGLESLDVLDRQSLTVRNLTP
jgi:hypothetical protein